MTNMEKADLERRLKALNPDYKFSETQSSRGVWKMLVVCFVIMVVAGIAFAGLSATNAYLLLVFWPIPLILAAGYYGIAVSSLFGTFVFKNRNRKIIAACVFTAWVISFVVQRIS